MYARKLFLFATLMLMLCCSKDDEKPIEVSVSDYTTTINENPANSQSLGIVEATTNQGNINFSITEQTPAGAFSINSSTGELTVLDATLFDFETNPRITGIIKVANGDVFENANINISLNDVLEIDITVSDFIITIDENPENGQSLGIVEAMTNQGSIDFSITEQTPAGAFEIDSATGELTVLDATLFDFETNPEITGIIGVVNGDASHDANIVISLNDVLEIDITVSDFIITIDENPENGQSLGIVEAITNQGSIDFSITEQTPAGAFEIDSATGELTVLDATLFDFETNPEITGIIGVVNGDASHDANIVISLNDVLEIDITVSDFIITIDENPENGQSLGMVEASTNQGDLNFSITEQTPVGAFEVNSSTGELTVLDAALFDFETNPEITGIIEVANGEVFDSVNVTITLNDITEQLLQEVVAGIGAPGYSGDGSAAISAELNTPRHLVFDRSGNLYFADQMNHVIRKIDANGIITTIAGSGLLGFSGDGGQAVSAQLNNPRGVCIDNDGNILIADSGNNAIRKIDNSGVITTIVGNGSPGFSGDNGLALNAQLNSPRGVRTDDLGNIYIADTDNHRVRKIGINDMITTIAGNGINLTSGDGGLAINANFEAPYDVIVNNDMIYIADITGSRVRVINNAGIISTILNNDRVHIIDSPSALNFDQNNNLYVSDLGGKIFKIDSLGNTTIAFDNDIDNVGGIAFDRDFNLFYSNTFFNLILKIDNSSL